MAYVYLSTVLPGAAVDELQSLGTVKAEWLPQFGPKDHERVVVAGGDMSAVHSRNFHHFVALTAQKRARSLRQTDSAATPPPTTKKRGLSSPEPARRPHREERPLPRVGGEGPGEPIPPVAPAWFGPMVGVTVGVSASWFVSQVADGGIVPLVGGPIQNAFAIGADIELKGRPVHVHNINLECRVGRSPVVEEALNLKWGVKTHGEPTE